MPIPMTSKEPDGVLVPPNLTGLEFQWLRDAGQIVTSEVTQPIMRAAQQFRVMNATGNLF